jgi:AraC family transcriptional activator of pobA
MAENALFSTITTLFIVLMAKAPPAPVEPILLRDLRLRCGGWSVHSLRVNRHLQPFDRVAPHRHPHGQLLLYLRGYGEQRIGPKRFSVGPGAVFFIPPGRIHEFREKAPRRAICLVANLGGEGPKAQGVSRGWLSAEALAKVRQQVAILSAESGHNLELTAGGAALLIIDTCRAACSKNNPPSRAGAGITERLRRALQADDQMRWPRPAELARRVGLQKDYLNRLVIRACGLTLGQWRDRELLRSAESKLRRGSTVSSVADELGFNDSSYFARWFRKQTGLTPVQWRGN